MARLILNTNVLIDVERSGRRPNNLIADVAQAHARLLAHMRRSGRSRGAHDLVIAATAVARDRLVVSTDASAFADLPGVAVRA